MPANPKLSVITVTFNAAAYLEPTLQSVREQEYPHIEHLIIDGGSTDGTVDIILRYEAGLAFWVSEPDAGIYDAMNKGVRHASGDWVLFLNAGDRFTSPSSVSKAMETARDESDLMIGGIRTLEPEGRVILSKPFEGIDGLYSHNPCYHQAAFARHDLLARFPFDTRYRLLADYAFMFACHDADCRFQELNFPVADILSGGVSDLRQSAAAVEGLAILSRHTADERLLFESRWFSILERRSRLSRHLELLRRSGETLAIYGFGALGNVAAKALGEQVVIIVDAYRTAEGVHPPEALKSARYDRLLVTVIEREAEVVGYLTDTLGIPAFKLVVLGRPA